MAVRTGVRVSSDGPLHQPRAGLLRLPNTFPGSDELRSLPPRVPDRGPGKKHREIRDSSFLG